MLINSYLSVIRTKFVHGIINGNMHGAQYMVHEVAMPPSTSLYCVSASDDLAIITNSRALQLKPMHVVLAIILLCVVYKLWTTVRSLSYCLPGISLHVSLHVLLSHCH